MAALNPAKYGPAVVGLSWRSFSPAGWLRLLAAPGLVPVARQLPLAILILAAFCWWPGRQSRRPYLIAGLLVFAAWLLPQLVLYSQGIAPRYLFPMILAPAATVSLGLAAVWPARSWLGRAAWVAQLLWLLPTLSDGVRATSEMANRFTAETWSVHRLVAYLARNVPPGRAIVVAADPAGGNGFEAVHALPVYLAAAGSASQTFLWPVGTRPDLRSAFAAEVETRTRATYALPETLAAGEVGGIILVDTPGSGDTLPRWFSDGRSAAAELRRALLCLDAASTALCERGRGRLRRPGARRASLGVPARQTADPRQHGAPRKCGAQPAPEDSQVGRGERPIRLDRLAGRG